MSKKTKSLKHAFLQISQSHITETFSSKQGNESVLINIIFLKVTSQTYFKY